MAPYQNPQGAISNGYVAYAASNAGHQLNQTYPAPQLNRKPVNGFTNGLQIPNQSYHPSSVHNNVDQYGMNQVSNVQQQGMYTDSPIDTTTFPSYFTQEPNNLPNNMASMSYDHTSGAQHQPHGTYSAMQYLAAQHNYNYQG